MSTSNLPPASVIDRSARARIMVSGPDRAKFLHNLTTNEVKRLKPGEGRESFVTSPQGKTLAAISYHLLDDRILIRSDLECRDALLLHLNKYGVFDDVSIEDVTGSTREWHVAGPEAVAVATGRFGAVPEADQAAAEVGGLIVVRDDPTGRGGVTLVGPADGPAPTSDLPELPAETFEAWRIEAGTPRYGQDVTPTNLPQEVGRDLRAINFVKGCYLGQETVARLDALGHVNKLLKGGIVEGEVPPPGAILKKEGVEVGTVTSSAHSGERGRGVLLGYVKVAKVAAGDVVTAEWEGGSTSVRVVDLPMPRD